MIPAVIFVGGVAVLVWLKCRSSKHPQSIDRYTKGKFYE